MRLFIFLFLEIIAFAEYLDSSSSSVGHVWTVAAGSGSFLLSRGQTQRAKGVSGKKRREK